MTTDATPVPLPQAPAPTRVGAADLAAKGINEVLFPIGCSLVLYASEALSRRVPG